MNNPTLAPAILRAGTAAVMISHGVARSWLGIVDDFGVYLGTQRFPAPLALAWTITIVEIIAGALLVAGFFVRPICGWFAFQLLMGIYLIHGRVGWFVIGAGRNGAEFSVFLLMCFALIAMTAPRAARQAPAPK